MRRKDAITDYWSLVLREVRERTNYRMKSDPLPLTTVISSAGRDGPEDFAMAPCSYERVQKDGESCIANGAKARAPHLPSRCGRLGRWRAMFDVPLRRTTEQVAQPSRWEAYVRSSRSAEQGRTHHPQTCPEQQPAHRSMAKPELPPVRQPNTSWLEKLGEIKKPTSSPTCPPADTYPFRPPSFFLRQSPTR